MRGQPDPYGDFSFEELGAEAAASATPSSSGVETAYQVEAAPADAGYKRATEPTDIEGVTPLGASFGRGGQGR
jgi:hypothetical protein